MALNESEAILTAEPTILIIWHGRDGLPNRVAGDMRGVVKVPADKDALLDFPSWLDPESANALDEARRRHARPGTPFNIGIRTLADELLEADGRTAGGFATLRLRPLAGERRQVTELAYDARRLGKQVERLSAVLDAAPFPVWLKDTSGEMIWVNDSYIKAVEAADVDAVIAGQDRDCSTDAKIEPPAGEPVGKPQGPQPCGDRRRQMRPRCSRDQACRRLCALRHRRDRDRECPRRN